MAIIPFLFSPKGRIGGTRFVIYHLIVLVAMLILGLISGLAELNIAIVINIIWLLLACPSLCLAAKRLHDTNHSARWLWLFVPGIAVTLIAQLGIGQAGGIVAGLFNLVAIISHMAAIGLILYLTLKRGDKSENDYGPVP